MTCCRNPATANLAQRGMGGLYQLDSGSQWKNNKQGPSTRLKDHDDLLKSNNHSCLLGYQRLDSCIVFKILIVS